MPLERLQKIISTAGVASRRKAEELISSGHVQVNGTTITELGSKADPETDHIRVNGKLLQREQQRHVYLLLNKPKGYVTTVSDPEDRPTVMDLLRGVRGRVYPIGRLDYASEGLLLLTNDGELANRLMKAASHVAKTYLVKVSGSPTEAAIGKLRAGVSIATDDGKRVRTGAAAVRIVKQAAPTAIAGGKVQRPGPLTGSGKPSLKLRLIIKAGFGNAPCCCGCRIADGGVAVGRRPGSRHRRLAVLSGDHRHRRPLRRGRTRAADRFDLSPPRRWRAGD
jgi:pseudouridine synthase